MHQLKDGTHPEYNRKVKRLEAQYKERLRLNIIYRDYLTECVDREYISDKKAAIKEFEEKKSDLKENLLADMEEKRKSIENDRYSMELTGDATEVSFLLINSICCVFFLIYTHSILQTCLDQLINFQIKPVMTRKLRRRPNEPVPEKVEKRRKPAPASVNYLLDDKEIESDLKAISRGKIFTTIRKPGKFD